ncbi:MAG: hypothetical protein LUG90_09585 [Clostridiaceae bacterium]|nr:hypothetical protein [Clostridiaceae bacterium]
MIRKLSSSIPSRIGRQSISGRSVLPIRTDSLVTRKIWSSGWRAAGFSRSIK